MVIWRRKGNGQGGGRFARGRGAVLAAARLLAALGAVAVAKDALPAYAGGEDAAGERLFWKDWVPGDPAAKLGGDGLGPLYNATSCVACHYQGGPGGSGPRSSNIQILAAGERKPDANIGALQHPGLAASRTVILHRYGVDPGYIPWRLRLLGDAECAELVARAEPFAHIDRSFFERVGLWAGTAQIPEWLDLSERNPPALFGLDLIDQIAEGTLLALEGTRFPGFPEVRGHARRLPGGRIGRFGWKAELPNLNAAVLASCANQLGLEVPGYHQARSPLAPNAPPPGVDLSEKECDALVKYVRHLPRPPGGDKQGGADPKEIATGRALFEAAGCATCHRQRLWDIDGIYSDLLMHDMGENLAATALERGGPHGRGPARVTAEQKEWRTPPLWGYAESGPYLHDGRARDLDEAVAFHSGEATEPTLRFFTLTRDQRLRIHVFLRSLRPPAPPHR